MTRMRGSLASFQNALSAVRHTRSAIAESANTSAVPVTETKRWPLGSEKARQTLELWAISWSFGASASVRK